VIGAASSLAVAYEPRAPRGLVETSTIGRQAWATQAPPACSLLHRTRDDGAAARPHVAQPDLFDEFVARVGEASGVAIGYKRTGTLDVALHDDAQRRLEALSGMLARRGCRRSSWIATGRGNGSAPGRDVGAV